MKRELKRQQRTVGAIVEIPLEDGFKTYARILDPYMAFYDIYVEELPEIEEILDSEVLFFTTVYDYVITKGYWLKVGKKLTLEEKLSDIPPFYTQDILNPVKYTIFIKGEDVQATKEECIGLEYLAVWKYKAMEKRLNDHFTGKKNKLVEKIKIAELHSDKKPQTKTFNTRLQRIDKEAV